MTKINKKQIRTEVLAGLTTFLTMSYIIFVNPTILATKETGMSFTGVMTATVLLCFTMTMLMGVYAKLPYAVAPGMGINAFFAYTIIIGDKVPWPTALGMVFWAGVLFLLISLTPLREKLAESLPHNLKVGCSVGIGMFLTFIGLKNSGLVVEDPVTYLKMGKLQGDALLTIGGLLVILPLLKRKTPAAFLIGIAVVTIASLALDSSSPIPNNLIAAPDFESVFFKLDILGALKLSFIPVILSIVFTDLFDSISTFVGVSRAGHLLDKHDNPLRMREGLIVDAWATLTAGLFGTSSGTAYIESATGIESGGRTGLTSIVTALCFLPFLFLAPLALMIPISATAPVLICVGILMFKNISDLKMEHFEDWVPAVLTIMLIPLTFSITKGLMWGLFIQFALYLLLGRMKKISPALMILGILSGLYLALS